MTANKKTHGIVLITGASSGIGRELVLEFGARSDTLVLVARRLERLEKLRDELLGLYPRLRVVALAADLSDEHEIEELLAKVSEQAGAVDVLVNNAGLGDSVLFDRSEWARTRQVLRTNIIEWPSLPQPWCPAWWSAAAAECSTSGQARALRCCQTQLRIQGASISWPDSAKRYAPTFRKQA